MEANVIKVKIKGYDVKVLDESVRAIMIGVVKTGVKVVGPIALPTKRKKWAVNRSPHVYKSAMEHFEMRIHQRLLEIVNASPKTIEALQNLVLPSGVSVELK